MITVILSEKDFDYEIQALVSSFFPGQMVCVQTEKKNLDVEEIQICIEMDQKQIVIQTLCGEQKQTKTARVSGEKDFHKHKDKTAHPYRTEYKNKLKKLLFDMLKEMKGWKLPENIGITVPVWGTMTGVRPTKIPMNEIRKGKSKEEIILSLKENYACSEEKANLCLQIAKKEAELLAQRDFSKGYSLYVGIPFCPTTCLYCSFPSYPLERFQKMVPEYLEALKKEIIFCGRKMQGKRLDTIYMGGGTPTSLSGAQMEELIQCIRDNFPVEQALEFTVEAGRPDSITEEKLAAIRKMGVRRISVNPQTMQNKTLDLIGRRHSAEQTIEAFEMARAAGFDNINMDLIAGLPEEGTEEFADTLEQIGRLSPDSLTIHSLVVKRASKLREIMDESGKFTEYKRAENMEKMLWMGEKFAHSHQLKPYYMYRQKNSAGYAGSSGQENIGFSLSGKECLYNILIMEEVQTILAVGAGASTKLYDPGKQLVSRVENVKSVVDYVGRIDEMLDRKEILGDL